MKLFELTEQTQHSVCAHARACVRPSVHTHKYISIIYIWALLQSCVTKPFLNMYFFYNYSKMVRKNI